MSSLKQWGMWSWMLGAALLVGCGEDKLQLEFIQPEELTATNRELTVTVRLQGGPPDRLALYVDDTWLTNLDTSSYVLDTRAWSEGEHTLTARASMGTEVFTSKGRKVVVDRTPPRVISVSPKPGESNVSVDAPISVYFSEPLAASSLESAGLELSVGGRTETLEPLELSSDGKMLFFAKPSRPIEPPLTVSAVLTGTVQDRVGNAFLPARDSGWSWFMPGFLSLGDAMESLDTSARPFVQWLTLRLDTQGRPMVAWMASLTSVQVRRWAGERRWDTISPAPPLEVGSTSHIELDEQGHPTVTWVQQGSSSSWASLYRLEAGTWKHLARIGPDANGSFPTIERAVGRLAPSGLVAMAWQAQPRTFSGTFEVMVASETSSSSWERSSHSTSALGGRGFVMELDTAYTTVTAWCESVQGGMRVGVQHWSVSQAAWVTPLPTRPGSVANPALVVQRNGYPVVAWSERGALQVYRWTGSAWEQLGQPFPTLSEQYESVIPVLALDGSGQLLFAWSMPGKAELWRWTESGWARLGVLSRPTTATTLVWPIALQVDGAGKPVLAWSRWDSSTANGVGSLEVFRLNR
jgi:hypothetical protein